MINKVLSISELSKKIDILKNQHKTIVHCHGVFDVVHLGHLKHFKEAKAQGDVLVVTITEDKYVNKGPNRPLFNQNQRAEYLAYLDMIDYVAINYDATAINVIKTLKPDIYIKGIEYKNIENDITGKITDEEEAVKSIGGNIYFTDDIVFSSSNIINTLYSNINEPAKEFLAFFKQKYNYKAIDEIFNSIFEMKVLVIGDVILDEYHLTKPVGMSSKSANISVKYLDTELHAGGILAIANHISTFVKNVDLFTLTGTLDNYDTFIENKLNDNVILHNFKNENKYTTKKTRYMDDFKGNKLFEVATVSDEYISSDIEKGIINMLQEKINSYDLVVLGDFGHFFITDKIIEFLENNAKFLAVNVQTNSLNYGFNTVRKINKADYLSIDEREIQLRFHDQTTSVEELIKRLYNSSNISKMSVTLGAKGTLVSDKEDFTEVPVFSSDTVDTVGAGDAYLSLSSLIATKTDDLDMIGFIGNIAGGMATKYLGNKTFLDKISVLKYINTLLK